MVLMDASIRAFDLAVHHRVLGFAGNNNIRTAVEIRKWRAPVTTFSESRDGMA
jgi:hypothetical protein